VVVNKPSRKGTGNVNRTYKSGGFKAVWDRFLKGSGRIKRKREATRWARLRASISLKPHPFRKAARIYGHKLHHAVKLRKKRLHRAKAPVTMYDSVEASALPPDAKAALYYADGPYENEAAVKARTPKAKHVGITVNGSTHHIPSCDSEPGDLTPAEAANWCVIEVRGGRRPKPYMSVSQVAEFGRELAARGLHLPDAHGNGGDVDMFTAHYIGPHLCSPSCGLGMPTTAVATQHTGSMVASHPDVSECEPAFFK
jgi:hypothetical protein